MKNRVITATAALWMQPVAAYVGPGAGLSLLAALWGLVIAIAAAIGFVVAWPLRRAWRACATTRRDDRVGQPARCAGAAVRGA